MLHYTTIGGNISQSQFKATLLTDLNNEVTPNQMSMTPQKSY